LIREASAALVPLSREFYLRPTSQVARDLLGRYLVRELRGDPPQIGRIVETEAYVGEQDRASHAFHGRTARTAPMYEEAGHAYVYLIYGMYWCLNVVTEPVGTPCAVLLRAVEPMDGVLGDTDGPGKVCRAFGIDGKRNRADLTLGPLHITAGEPFPSDAVQTSPRIGVGYAGDWAAAPLRFFISSSPHVSRPGSPAKVTRASAPSPAGGEAQTRSPLAGRH
jgi:DNA-3-methyladenine glycosylase